MHRDTTYPLAIRNMPDMVSLLMEEKFRKENIPSLLYSPQICQRNLFCVSLDGFSHTIREMQQNSLHQNLTITQFFSSIDD